ncbi:MAG: hypothetical protein P0Y59_11605 [Candidatus Sphingomonas phytovorans]|nr:hypothetical protein [Sphingomonas sp.]WEK02292.1 MAG: hypothetical protein P0Y59_11605 [Sphingomonas sp.]
MAAAGAARRPGRNDPHDDGRVSGMASQAGREPATLQRMLVVDTLVAVLVNAVAFPLLLRAAGLPPPRAMLGREGAVIDGILATVCPVLLMTILMTFVLRARFARQLPADSAISLARFSRLPRQVIVRAVSLALIALPLLLPLRVAIIWALGLLPMNTSSHFALNMFHGCLIALAFMPVILLGTRAEFRGTHSTDAD